MRDRRRVALSDEIRVQPADQRLPRVALDSGCLLHDALDRDHELVRQLERERDRRRDLRRERHLHRQEPALAQLARDEQLDLLPRRTSNVERTRAGHYFAFSSSTSRVSTCFFFATSRGMFGSPPSRQSSALNTTCWVL